MEVYGDTEAASKKTQNYLYLAPTSRASLPVVRVRFTTPTEGSSRAGDRAVGLEEAAERN